jgi:hypothetical protein
MNALLKTLLIICLLFASNILFAEGPRHKAKGGYHIIEIVPGQLYHGSQTDYSFGLDYEFFPNEDHHYSLGFSYEAEFIEKTEHFIGAHIAWYFLGHNKLFLASGLGWNREQSFWKQKVGYGYEVIFKNHFVIVPSIGIEHSPLASHSVISLGLGFEF